MKSVLRSFVAALAVAGIAQGANAAATLSIFDGVNPLITITDNGPGDLNPATGELTLSTNVGVWSLSISSGLTKPALGTATNPVMDLVVQATSTTTGTLQYVFSDGGFTRFSAFTSTVSGHVISGAPTTIDYSVYGDPINQGELTSLLTTTGTLPLPVLTSNSGTLLSSSFYSLSEVVQLTASGPSSVSVDASLNVIPEPSTIALTFLGLAFLLSGLARRRRPLHSGS